MTTGTLYLASKSPRRRELLKLTGLDFEFYPPPDLDENALLDIYSGDVLGQAEWLALEKAKAVLNQEFEGIFITADTLVISDDGVVLGKPSDEKQAGIYIDRLAGNWHTVVTGVVLSEFPSGRVAGISERTRVKFGPMSNQEIRDYIATSEPFDKAGGYGIQGRASVYIEKIDGCYFNVVGFPLHAFWKMWKSFTSGDI